MKFEIGDLVVWKTHKNVNPKCYRIMKISKIHKNKELGHMARGAGYWWEGVMEGVITQQIMKNDGMSLNPQPEIGKLRKPTKKEKKNGKKT